MFFFALTTPQLNSNVPTKTMASLAGELRLQTFRCAPVSGSKPYQCTFANAGLVSKDPEFTTFGPDQNQALTRLRLTKAHPGHEPRTLLLSLTFAVDAASGGLSGTLHRVSNSGRALYYHVGADGSFYAATHLRLLKAAGIAFEEDPSVLPELLMYRMLICPQTLVKNIRQLRAGETVIFNSPRAASTTFSVSTTAIFDPPKAGATFDESELVTNAQSFLENAFTSTNCQPDRFGSLLSGGLDSTLLTKLAFDLFGTKDSFSCSYPFEDPRDDIEENYARSAAANIGTRHHVYVPTMAQYLHGVIDTVYRAEQPMMHLQSVLLHLIYKHEFAPRGVNMIANGEGADGMFGLKTHRFAQYLADHPGRRALLGLPPVRFGLRLVSTLTNRFGLIARMAGTSIDPATPLTDPNHILWSDAVFGYWPWIRNYTKSSLSDTVRGRAAALSEYQNRSLLEQISLTAFAGEGTQTQLIWSMIADASNISLFYPFPNPKLVDAAYRAPWSYKLGEPKKALRDVARRLGIAEFIITRPKAAFGIRSERYGPRNTVIEPLIAVAAKGIEESALRSLQSPEIYKAQTLWTLLNLGIWRRLFIHGETTDALHHELDSELHRLGVAARFNKPGRVDHMIT